VTVRGGFIFNRSL